MPDFFFVKLHYNGGCWHKKRLDIDMFVLKRLMRKDGWPAMCIHGDKQQKEREWVLGEFKTGSTAILVATDVAARGLDVDDVKFVINYDYPNNSEDYIHRIGEIKFSTHGFSDERSKLNPGGCPCSDFCIYVLH